MAVISLGVLAVALAICWVAGLVEFTYPRVVPNEPLLRPQKVRDLDGTNLVLETGEVIGLWPRYHSERSNDEIFVDISNQLSRGGFEVDVASNSTSASKSSFGGLESFPIRYRPSRFR